LLFYFLSFLLAILFYAAETEGADGMKKGRKERDFEIAEKLLDILDNETIAEKTGLSVEDVEKLREKLQDDPQGKKTAELVR